MKTFEKYLFNILANVSGFVLCPLPRSFANKYHLTCYWRFYSRNEWNINFARAIVYALGLKKVHEERIEEFVKEFWYNNTNEKTLPVFRRHYSPVRKEVHKVVKNQPKQVSLEEAKQQIKKCSKK